MVADQQPQQQQQPVITDTKRVNCPFIVSLPDENGNREISFIVGPAQLETFVVSPTGVEKLQEALSGGLAKPNAAEIAVVGASKKG